MNRMLLERQLEGIEDGINNRDKINNLLNNWWIILWNSLMPNVVRVSCDSFENFALLYFPSFTKLYNSSHSFHFYHQPKMVTQGAIVSHLSTLLTKFSTSKSKTTWTLPSFSPLYLQNPQPLKIKNLEPFPSIQVNL